MGGSEKERIFSFLPPFTIDQELLKIIVQKPFLSLVLSTRTTFDVDDIVQLLKYCPTPAYSFQLLRCAIEFTTSLMAQTWALLFLKGFPILWRLFSIVEKARQSHTWQWASGHVRSRSEECEGYWAVDES